MKDSRERRGQYKKGINSEDARRQREDQADQLRKAKREEQLSKRRQHVESGDGDSPREVVTEEKVRKTTCCSLSTDCSDCRPFDCS